MNTTVHSYYRFFSLVEAWCTDLVWTEASIDGRARVITSYSEYKVRDLIQDPIEISSYSSSLLLLLEIPVKAVKDAKAPLSSHTHLFILFVTLKLSQRGMTIQLIGYLS